MEIEELKNEDAFALFAPDGSIQCMTIAFDYATCSAVLKMLEKAKMMDSPAKLFQRGFKIMPIKISIIPNGDEKSGYQKAVAPLKN